MNNVLPLLPFESYKLLRLAESYELQVNGMLRSAQHDRV